MKALVLQKPGLLEVEDRATPQPAENEVLVRISHAGICGSDIHYFKNGGFGTVRVKAPMVLGHELSGVVAAVGKDVTRVSVGQRVAVNPSGPCHECDYCRSGRERLCTNMQFMGSAMRTPHNDGGFREYVTCPEAQAVPVPDSASLNEIAAAEPLSVCLHAVSQAGDIAGRRVLVTGFGPIGALTFLACRHAGVAELCVADVAPAPLALAAKLSASTIYDVSKPDAIADEKRDRGQFDVVFECSGHPASIQTAIEVTKPGGTIVQVGMTPDTVTLAINPLITKEITLKGTFRFDAEFERAVQLIASREIDVSPVLSGSYPYNDALNAFAAAMDRDRAIKVMLDFS